MVLQQQRRQFIKKKPLPRLQPGRGFSITTIKLIALCCMITDHLHYIFSSFYPLPLGLRYIGRISFPLFILAIVEGYSHTKYKKKYMLRLLIFSLIIYAVNTLLNYILSRQDGFQLQANIFPTLFLMTLYMYLLDNLKNRYQTIYSAAALMALMPLTNFVEYGPIFILLAITMYHFKTSRYKQALTLIIFSLLYIQTYQIFMLASVPFILLYNGEKGLGLKPMFYIIYPTHLWIFYIISYFIK